MSLPAAKISASWWAVPLLLGLLVAPAGAGPCDAPEHRQFDFWLGDWDVFTPDGALAGTNRIERVAGGCGLLEDWTGARGGTGRSINFWSPEDRRWHQTWAGSGASFLFLSGELRDGAMVMTGSVRDTSGTVQQQRITWTPLEGGRVRQHWQQSADGKTWTDAFVGEYRKR